jgi:hypothetical protein
MARVWGPEILTAIPLPKKRDALYTTQYWILSSNWPAFQAKSSAAELNLLSGSRIIKPKETQPTDFSWIYGTEPDGAWRVVRVVFAHIVPI